MSIVSRIKVSYDTYAWQPTVFSIGAAVTEDRIHDTEMPCELVGSGRIATGSVRKIAAF